MFKKRNILKKMYKKDMFRYWGAGDFAVAIAGAVFFSFVCIGIYDKNNFLLWLLSGLLIMIGVASANAFKYQFRIFSPHFSSDIIFNSLNTTTPSKETVYHTKSGKTFNFKLYKLGGINAYFVSTYGGGRAGFAIVPSEGVMVVGNTVKVVNPGMPIKFTELPLELQLDLQLLGCDPINNPIFIFPLSRKDLHNLFFPLSDDAAKIQADNLYDLWRLGNAHNTEMRAKIEAERNLHHMDISASYRGRKYRLPQQDVLEDDRYE